MIQRTFFDLEVISGSGVRPTDITCLPSPLFGVTVPSGRLRPRAFLITADKSRTKTNYSCTAQYASIER
ncbi:MAG: hypothetical protein ABJV68_06560 [Paracoccaceae bacterium]